jgi:hypothetical protein
MNKEVLATIFLFAFAAVSAVNKPPIPVWWTGVPKISSASKTKSFVPAMEGNIISAGKKQIHLNFPFRGKNV